MYNFYSNKFKLTDRFYKQNDTKLENEHGKLTPKQAHVNWLIYLLNIYPTSRYVASNICFHKGIDLNMGKFQAVQGIKERSNAQGEPEIIGSKSELNRTRP